MIDQQQRAKRIRIRGDRCAQGRSGRLHARSPRTAMNARLPDGPCLCGASDCPSCGPAQGYTILDSDALEGFIQSEIAEMRRQPEMVSSALGSLSEDEYATTDLLVFEAIEDERTTGFDPKQLQAIGEHLVMSVLRHFDEQARAL